MIIMMITHRKSEKVDSSIDLALLLGDQLSLDRGLHLLDEASRDHHLVRDILTLMIIIIVVKDTLFLSAALLISLLASVFSPRATSQRTDSGAQYLE